MNTPTTHPGIVTPYGFMLAGKTKIGKMLAERLGISFEDVDEQLVERLSIKSITAFIDERKKHHGGDIDKAWEDFAKEENITFAQMLKSDEGKVISPGGRLIMNPKNRELIQETKGLIRCYLEVDLEEQVRRALSLTPKQLENRPTLVDDNGELLSAGELREFFDESMHKPRGPVYDSFAPEGMTFNTGGEQDSFDDVVDKILSALPAKF